MFASLRALLSGVIDYAGMFPPAQLSLDQAIRNYARYRQEPESWMLGRFVCPAARLAELVPYLGEIFQEGAPLTCSALGRGATEGVEFKASLREDLQYIVEFRHQVAGRALIDVIETKAAVHFNMMWAGTVQNQIEQSPGDKPVPFIETGFGDNWRASLGLAILHLAAVRRLHSDSRCGFKVRCGGLHASAFPTPEQIAFTIVMCRVSSVPLKFTAGLHHPIRHFDPDLQTHMHGFISVFAAAVLAHARHLDEDQVRAILEDEDSHSFVFDDNGFHWKDRHATTEEIVAARREVVSFGSCSFDEPREDLRKLGWLD